MKSKRKKEERQVENTPLLCKDKGKTGRGSWERRRTTSCSKSQKGRGGRGSILLKGQRVDLLRAMLLIKI